MTGQETRHKLTGYWREHDIKAGQEFAALAVLSTRQIAMTSEATGLGENKTAAKAGGGMARQARKQLGVQTGQPVVLGDNYWAGVKTHQVLRRC